MDDTPLPSDSSSSLAARASATGGAPPSAASALDDRGATSGREIAAAVPLVDLLAAAGLTVAKTFSLEPARAVALQQPDGAIAVDVDAPPDGAGQLLLSIDAAGVQSWHFSPPGAAQRATGVATSARRRYLLPAPLPQTSTTSLPSRPAAQGLFNPAVRRLLRVVLFPLADPVLGAVGESLARSFEERRRPYRLRSFTPDDYRCADAAPIDAEGWRRLASGRALLLVHGTFSRAHGAFADLPRPFVEELYRRYGGRVFAFDHWTLSHDPPANVQALLDRVPENVALDLDILCHSRGGLVSRLLVERGGAPDAGARRIDVGRVVFAGAPNAGTALADVAHLGALLDGYTNVLSAVAATAIPEIVEAVAVVARHLAVGALAGLDGLRAMRPDGAFLRDLNRGVRTGARRSATRYFALASDFTPATAALGPTLIDRLADRFFHVGNDLIVPTASVYDANGSGYFPIQARHVFDGRAAVPHTGYFANPVAREKILQWLAT